MIRVVACQGACLGFLQGLLRDYIFGACSGLHGLLETHPAEKLLTRGKGLMMGNIFFLFFSPALMFIVCHLRLILVESHGQLFSSLP